MTLAEVTRATAAHRRPDPAEPAGPSTRWWDRPVLPWAVLGLCIGCFVPGARSIASSPFDQYGLLAGASPLYAVSIVLACVGFGVAVRQRNPLAAGAAILAMIICQRLPRAISTEAPMYAWTYKHLGVVDHVQQTHSLAHGVDVYNGWPGLFVVTAWISDLTGVAPGAIAHWFTPVYHVVLATLVFAAARAWRLSRDESLVATFLVVTLNWVEQDYFAPQAIGMLLTVGIVALLGLSDKKPTGTVPLLILFGALAITHQLTPYWVLGASCLLVLGRKLKPWWTVLVMAAILGGFLVYNIDVLTGYTLLSGDVADNASTNGSGHVGMAGQVLSSTVMRVLTIGMWSTTAVVLLFRWRRGREFWASGVLALSPILILGAQSYGGEAVFRVFLYSLPGCAFVLAPGLVEGLRGGWKRVASTFLALAMATAMAAQATTANWYTNLIGSPQVAVAGEILAGNVYPAYVTPLVPVWPERSTGDYVRFAEFTDTFDHSLMFQPGLLGRSFASETDYRQLMGLLEARNRPTYLVLSEPMRAFGAYFGLFPGDAITNLTHRLRSDPRWQVVDERPGVWVYLYPNETR